jgi:hypothetical protein
MITVRKRRAPPEPPADPNLLQHHLRMAQPDRPKAVIAEARRKLLQLHENGKLTGIAKFRLSMFIDDLTVDVWSSNNPGEVLAEARNGTPKRRRGRPRTREYEHRDFMIAVDVAECMRKGMSRDEACAKVAGLAHLSFERVMSIYSDQMRHKGALVRLEASCRAVRSGQSSY